MIQAITQTMIGEYLWKYTRKTASGEMSNTRHRRYFWVHPYTRMLYWSEQDPQTAGKSEVRAKSVPIEAIRVITDDNPYPPGLHRKSLEVVTPYRRIRFTASTSQRHETWLNALSYLLLRTSDGEAEDQDHLTSEDVAEFNPAFRNHSRPANPRVSLSSFNSRTSRNTSNTRAASAMSIRPAVTPGRASPSLSAQQNSTLRASDPARHSSASRLSTVINATIRGSFSSRRSRHAYAEGSIYDSSVADHDSAEDLRQAIERQEREADRLENVRACCDGKSGGFHTRV
jgi:Meiotic cell cortex C-terminal pleckstrin homology